MIKDLYKPEIVRSQNDQRKSKIRTKPGYFLKLREEYEKRGQKVAKKMSII